MKKRNEFFSKVKPAHIAALFLVIYLILIFLAPKILSEDEIFYYDQAVHIRQLEFVNFDNTQPLLYPLVLALTFSKNIIFLRLISTLFAVLSIYFLFIIVESRFNKKVAILSTLMLGFSKFFIQYSVTLHTETMLILMIILSFKYFLKSQDTLNLKDFLLLGVFSGLAMQTKVMGISIPIIFSFYLLYNKPRELFRLKYLFSLVLSFLIFLPYFFVGGIKFLFEKSTYSRGIDGESFFAIQQLLPYLTISFFVLLLLVLFFAKVKKKNDLFYIYPILFFILMLVPKTILITRQFLPVVPFLFVVIADFVFSEKSKFLRYFTYAIIILFFISNIRVLPDIPRSYSKAYYIEVPEGCYEIKELEYGAGKIQLPFFIQPSDSYNDYSSEFLIKENYSYVIMEYLDDALVEFKLDNRSYVNNFSEMPNWKSRGVLNVNIPEGKHKFDFTIYNHFNIGGIGQLLLCKESKLHDSVMFLFPIEESI